MGRDDWYRNKTWTEEIERAFFAKLARARDKAQYVRIQACVLAEAHPHVALRLLDHYFALEADYDAAQAYVDRATAYLSLGETAKAVECYEAALAAEKKARSVLTRAYVSFPFLVACGQIAEKYQTAVQVLRHNKARLMFPLDHFQWHAAYALISRETGDTAEAREHARLALAAASKEHSGFRYHPSIGLVGNKYENLRERLAVAAA